MGTELLSQSISGGVLAGDKSTGLFLSCQAFVSGGEGRRKPIILDVHHLYYPGTVVLPVSQGIRLNPSPSVPPKASVHGAQGSILRTM